MVGSGLVGLLGGRGPSASGTHLGGAAPGGSAGRLGGQSAVGQVAASPAHGQRAVQALLHADPGAPRARLHGAALELIALVLLEVVS
jgi:hypothetical protein